MDEFTRHIFGTLTYARTETIQTTWKTISNDFNRYIQRFRRTHNEKIQYLRVIERHKDLYPHIHIIIQFPNASIRIRDSKWIDRELYKNWKTLWKRGHSDYQKPRSSKTGTISYIMKYLLKNTTQKTVWKKIIPKTSVQMHKGGTPPSTPPESTKMNGVKLCTWSRGFDWKPFKPKHDEEQ